MTEKEYKRHRAEIHECGKLMHRSGVEYRHFAEWEESRLSADNHYQSRKKDRSSELAMAEELFRMHETDFCYMTGFFDMCSVPRWFEYWLFTGQNNRSHYHRNHQEGMPTSSTVKRVLFKERPICGITGEPLRKGFEIDHILPLFEFNIIYSEGLFLARDEDGMDYHSWENVRLVNKDAHQRKSSTEQSATMLRNHKRNLMNR